MLLPCHKQSCHDRDAGSSLPLAPGFPPGSGASVSSAIAWILTYRGTRRLPATLGQWRRVETRLELESLSCGAIRRRNATQPHHNATKLWIPRCGRWERPNMCLALPGEADLSGISETRVTTSRLTASMLSGLGVAHDRGGPALGHLATPGLGMAWQTKRLRNP